MEISKIFLGVVLLVLASSYAMGQYIRSKELNIAVTNSKRLCYGSENEYYFGEGERKDCVQKAEAQYINFNSTVAGTIGYIVAAGAVASGVYFYLKKKDKTSLEVDCELPERTS